MNTHTCPTCGAVTRHAEPLRLQDIPGNEHVKRGLEVALTGHHTVGITGWQAQEFGRWATTQHLAVYATQTCPCGNYGDVVHECRCTPGQIRRWRGRKAYQLALHADIWLTAVRPNQYKLNDLRREPDEVILERVQAGQDQPRPAEQLTTEPTLALQRAWLSQIQQPERMPQILRVAATIAQLSTYWVGDHEHRIEPAHLAEAMQYTPRQGDE